MICFYKIIAFILTFSLNSYMTFDEQEQSLYQPLLEQYIGKTDASVIIRDIVVNVDDVLRTDAGEIGYIRYTFTAKVIESQSDEIFDEIHYTMVYEGSLVPQINTTPHYLAICKDNITGDWYTASQGMKLPLVNESFYKYTKDKIYSIRNSTAEFCKIKK